MRKIKFRGFGIKRKNEGKWLYGNYYFDGSFYYIFPFNEDDKYFVDYQVDKETIGQFTGLYDKNGKEIYEGDIIKSGYSGSQEHIVCFGEYNNEESYEDNEWGYGWFTINTKNEVSSVVCLDYHNNVEVIGNIHEDSL